MTLYGDLISNMDILQTHEALVENRKQRVLLNFIIETMEDETIRNCSCWSYKEFYRNSQMLTDQYIELEEYEREERRLENRRFYLKDKEKE